MREFENIVIGNSAIPSLIISVILMIAIPVIFFIYWLKKHRQKIRLTWLVAGIVGFIVSSRVLEQVVHLVCLVTDNPISRFINGNTIAYVLYGITMAGVFEECGRFIILRFIMKKNRTRENVILYGIGHGGIEVLTVVLPAIIVNLAIVVLFSFANIETALSILNITEETAAVALPSVQSAAAFNYGMMAMNVIERLLAMLLHIGCTVIVYYGVVNAKKAFLPFAIILHMLVDTFAVMYQRGVVSLWMTEIWVAIWTCVTVFIAVKLYRKMK